MDPVNVITECQALPRYEKKRDHLRQSRHIVPFLDVGLLLDIFPVQHLKGTHATKC